MRDLYSLSGSVSQNKMFKYKNSQEKNQSYWRDLDRFQISHTTRLGQLGTNISPDRSSLMPQVLIGNFLKHNYPLLYELQSSAHQSTLFISSQGRWCIPRCQIHNSNYIFNLPAMITLNLFSKYLNDWWLNVHSKIIIPKEHICFYICWQIKYYF